LSKPGSFDVAWAAGGRCNAPPPRGDAAACRGRNDVLTPPAAVIFRPSSVMSIVAPSTVTCSSATRGIALSAPPVRRSVPFAGS
jgi:hypothetical protein